MLSQVTSATAPSSAYSPDRFAPMPREEEERLASLIRRASMNLTDDDLRHLAHMQDEAEMMLGHIATIAEGVACLSATDSQHQARAGTFEDPAALFDLLNGLASMARGAQSKIRAAALVESILASRPVASRA